MTYRDIGFDKTRTVFLKVMKAAFAGFATVRYPFLARALHHPDHRPATRTEVRNAGHFGHGASRPQAIGVRKSLGFG